MNILLSTFCSPGYFIFNIYPKELTLIPLYLFSSASAVLLLLTTVTLPSLIYHPTAHQSNDNENKNSYTHSQIISLNT